MIVLDEQVFFKFSNFFEVLISFLFTSNFPCAFIRIPYGSPPPFYRVPLCGHWHTVKGLWLPGLAHYLPSFAKTDQHLAKIQQCIAGCKQSIHYPLTPSFLLYVGSGCLPSLHPSLKLSDSGASRRTLCFSPWNQSSSMLKT